LCDFIRSGRPKLIESIKSFAEFCEKAKVISEQESLELC
jgi:hypothetical protein